MEKACSWFAGMVLATVAAAAPIAPPTPGYVLTEGVSPHECVSPLVVTIKAINEASDCLEENAYAGADDAIRYRSAVLETPEFLALGDAKSTAEGRLLSLLEKKNKEVWVHFIKKDRLRSAWRDEVVLLSGFTVRGLSKTAVDLDAAEAYFLIETAGLFSKEKKVFLKDIRRLSYKKDSGTHLWDFKLVTKDGAELSGTAYEQYPLRVKWRREKGESWGALTLIGTERMRINQFNGNAEDSSRQFELKGSSQYESDDWSFEVLSDTDVAKHKLYLDRLVAASDQRQAEEDNVAAEKRQAQAERDQADQQNREKSRVYLVTQKVGSEDSCSRMNLSSRRLDLAETTSDPSDAKVLCQISGETTLSSLRESGWLIVNKERSTIHVGNDVVTQQPVYNSIVINYFVRKAR